MARPWRIEFPGACFHVINRGNYRRNLFDGKGATEAFERTLGEAATRFGWSIHAYVVMSTHFHLALELAEPNLSIGMKWLQGTWIRRYNRLRQLVGRPFQGRYKALLVEPGHSLAQICHYIHLNPVRAGLVRADRARDYAWSSLPKFPEKDRPAWLEAAVVLGEAGELPDTRAGWDRYRQYLEFLATDDTQRKQLVSRRLSRGWCLGSPGFQQEMRRRLRQRGADLERFAGLEPAQLRAERAIFWEETLRALAAGARIQLEHLPAQRSHPAKCLLAATMKLRTSVSNGWLAVRLKMGPPASVSQFARRHLQTPAGAAAAALVLSKVKT
jgi:REP element-mobilizing transposase RayT